MGGREATPTADRCLWEKPRAPKKCTQPFPLPRIAGNICALQTPHPDPSLHSSLSLSQVP